MSWLSELKWSNRLEHLYAMIAGEEELDESVPSTYDRKQGFLYHIAEKIQGGTLPDASEASDGDVLTIDDGAPTWAAGGGGGSVVATFTVEQDPKDNSEIWSCDKTYAELKEAYDAGATLIAQYTATFGGQSIPGRSLMSEFEMAADVFGLVFTDLIVGGSSGQSATFLTTTAYIYNYQDQDHVNGQSVSFAVATT